MKKIIVILTMFSLTSVFAQEVKRVEVENVQKFDASKPLSSEQIESYNHSFDKFVDALKNSDKNKVGDLISEKVKTIVTDNIIEKLSGGINFEKKAIVNKSGYQTLINGEKYPAIEYRYDGSDNNEPKNLITVIFEEDGKILGLKPNYMR